MAGRTTITAPGAPTVMGPYCHAVKAQGLLWCAGQLPLDPVSGDLVTGDAAAQALQCLRNLEAVCEAAGTALSDAVRVTVYLTDMEQFSAVNEAYAQVFADDPPARVAVGVAALPRGAEVEIDAVVALPA
ncbi:MAG: Rid family detoxifying hydrolase [Solirubrobacterales bacterium]